MLDRDAYDPVAMLRASPVSADANDLGCGGGLARLERSAGHEAVRRQRNHWLSSPEVRRVRAAARTTQGVYAALLRQEPAGRRFDQPLYLHRARRPLSHGIVPKLPAGISATGPGDAL